MHGERQAGMAGREVGRRDRLYALFNMSIVCLDTEIKPTTKPPEEAQKSSGEQNSSAMRGERKATEEDITRY